MKLYKLTIVFKGGGSIIIKCRKYKISRLTENKDNRELTISGADREWTIDIDEIAGFTAKAVWF